MTDITTHVLSLPDDELVETVQEIRRLTPNIGQQRLLGALRHRGIWVQRERVRQILRMLDPVGTALRWRAPIYRRRYSVPAPNCLWHIDGNHKLIRYRLVIHCCIDGYSRLLVYVHCANNNRAETVLELFTQGAQEYGIPSRVRSDHGLENVGVAKFMLENRGLNRGSMITGSSVHNCRVERIHRDVYAGVLCYFVQLFDSMEEEGILDPLSDNHLYCLHFIYIPRIQKSLQEFVQQWNQHPMSTTNYLSPLQMYTAGIIQNVDAGYLGLPQEQNQNFYGIDPDGPFPIDEDYQVHVPEINSDLTDDQIQALRARCRVFDDGDGTSGIEAYLTALAIVSGA